MLLFRFPSSPMNDVMVVSIVIVCAVAISRCGSNDRQLLIVVLHVTPCDTIFFML